MKGTTHLMAGFAVGTALASQAGADIPYLIASIVCAGFGSLLPDLDSTTSKLGRKLLPASVCLRFLFGHRTLCHAPLLYFVLGFFSYRHFPDQSLLITACLSGVVSHLFLDMLNPAGIPLFWPMSKRTRIANIRSGGTIDSVLGVLLAVLFLTNLINAFL